MKTIILSALLVLSACGAPELMPALNVNETEPSICNPNNCDGCCDGDVCIVHAAQTDDTCGHFGLSCHSCTTYANPWTSEEVSTVCARRADGGEFGTGGCIKKGS